MRRFIGTLLVLLAASVGVLAAYGATWAAVTVPFFTGAGAESGPGRQLLLSGRDLAPLGAAMGWVGLAGIAALLATRTWGRRVTGGIVAIAGGCAGVIGVVFGLTEAASGSGGAFVEAALGLDAQPVDVTVSAWWIVAALAGLAMAACGIVAVVDGAAWPRLGARYSRSVAGGAPVTAAATWDALDRGEDPTAGDEPAPGEPGSMGDTDVHRSQDRWEEET